MLAIQQNKDNFKELRELKTKIKKVKVDIDSEGINKSIAKISDKVLETDDLKEVSRLRDAIRGLSQLKRQGTVEVNWVYEGGLLVNKGYNLDVYRNYGINYTDFIIIRDDISLIQIDCTKLADIIAFDLMFRDLGIDNNEIERRLSDIGLIDIKNIDILTKKYKENYYLMSKDIRIEDTPYKDLMNGGVVDYFGFKKFYDKTYKNVVSFSCRRALTLMLHSILTDKCLGLETLSGLEVYNLSDTEICFGLQNVSIIDDLDTRIFIRLFGRQFEVDKEIRVY